MTQGEIKHSIKLSKDQCYGPGPSRWVLSTNPEGELGSIDSKDWKQRLLYSVTFGHVTSLETLTVQHSALLCVYVERERTASA